MTWPVPPSAREHEADGIDPFAAWSAPPPPTSTPSAASPTVSPTGSTTAAPDSTRRRTPAELLAPVQLAAEPPPALGVPLPPRPALPAPAPSHPTRADPTPSHPPASNPTRSDSTPTGSTPDRPATPPYWEPPPRGRRRGRLLGTAAVLVVAVLGAAWALVPAVQRTAVLSDGQPVDAGEVRYTVPASWQVGPGGPATVVDGIALGGVATGPRYTCGGRAYARATVGSVLLVAGAGQADANTTDPDTAGPDAAADQFGPLFALGFYGPGAGVSGRPPVPLLVGGVNGVTSLVTVRTEAADGCPSRTGQLQLVALPTARDGVPAVLLVVLQRDRSGGPDDPSPVPDRVLTAILDSVRVSDR